MDYWIPFHGYVPGVFHSGTVRAGRGFYPAFIATIELFSRIPAQICTSGLAELNPENIVALQFRTHALETRHQIRAKANAGGCISRWSATNPGWFAVRAITTS